MNIRTGIAPFILAVCVISGCVPQEYTLRPGASGKVIDASNGKPIVDARVIVEGPLMRTAGDVYISTRRTGRAETKTGDDGQFSIDPLKAWRPHSAVDASDSPLIAGQIIVEKYGYKTCKTMFTTDRVINVGAISLRHR